MSPASIAKRLDVAAAAAAKERRTGVFPTFDLARRIHGSVPGIVVTTDATLGGLTRAAPDAVKEVEPGVFEIRRTLFVTGRATLTIDAREVREVRLVSRRAASRGSDTVDGFASIVAGAGGAGERRRPTRPLERIGRLVFRGRVGRPLVVRSWDPERHDADTNLADGRASIVARGGSTLKAVDTTFRDLGFYEGRFSGVALFSRRSTPGTGRVEHCRFEGNLFGAYTYEAQDMRWVANAFVGNNIYGFDPHDNSDGFLVEDNYVAGNGRHGIIFSRLTDRNVIRRNLVERNQWHGIVLDDGKDARRTKPLGPANHNRVSRNAVRDNGRVGILIDGSRENVVRDNLVLNGRHGIKVYGPSAQNRVERNQVAGARRSGVQIDAPSVSTSIAANDIRATRTGVRVRGTRQTRVASNRITGVDSHGIKADAAPTRRSIGVEISGNRIQGRGRSPLYVATGEGVNVGENTWNWDYPLWRKVARMVSWGLGPAFWLFLGLVIVGAPAASRVAKRLGGGGARPPTLNQPPTG